jgi:hypothetical protein
MKKLFRGINATEQIICMMFYLNRVVTNSRLRAVFVSIMCKYIRRNHRDEHRALECRQQAVLDGLHSDGYAPLGNLLGQTECREIMDFLRDKNLTDRDNCRAPFCMQNAPPGTRLADFGLADVIACPHILALANRPSLLRLASDYIGCKPTLSAMVIRWSSPEQTGVSDLQRFHRDTDDWRFLKVMVYLTDVDEFCGPHVYVKATHCRGQTLRQRFWTDEEMAQSFDQSRFAVATGGMGSAFAVDTSGIHKGQAPTRAYRLMLMLQYSLLPCYQTRKKPVNAVRPQHLDSYINRLIFSSQLDS